MKEHEREVPTGRLGRLARMARLGARTGASLLLSRSGDSAARQAAEVLGTMRGLAAKVGQLASYVDGLVPEEHRAAYEEALRALQSATVRSPAAAVRALVEEELGGPIDRLFGEWDDEPFASASIGQVHRARLLSGQEVAVKVQHPGITRAVESDLANAGLVEALVGGLVGRHFESRRLFEEVQARLREELDYELEAARQQEFARLHAGDPDIRIPAVIGERSSRRVLTTELVHGARLEEAARRPAAERRRYAEVLWRFVYRGNLVGGMFNADPHPGNYLFQPDGGIAFLDFGCVERFTEQRRRLAVALHRAAWLRDEDAFRQRAAALLQTRGGRWEEIVVSYARRSFEPLFRSPYRITSDYVASLIQQVRDRKLEVLRLGRDEFVPPPPGMILINRLQFGFFSVLARLDVEVDYVAVERSFLADAG